MPTRSSTDGITPPRSLANAFARSARALAERKYDRFGIFARPG